MLIKKETLCERVEELLISVGVSPEQATIISDILVDADMYGVTTHGTAILPSHIKRIVCGGYNLTPNISTVNSSPSFSVIDADNAIGFVSAKYCMDLAIQNCRKTGIHTVFSRNSNTYGAAYYYPLMAAKKGLIGISCSNSPTAMAPMGGKSKLFGTNPLSVAIPFDKDNNSPIIIDMATSKVAKSKFLQAKKEGKQLPEGWAMDVDGNPTTDPDLAIQGLVCPMEGYKGYGLALIIDFLAGFLSGAAWQDKVNRFYSEDKASMNVGQLFICIDPKAVFGDDYFQMAKLYVENIRKSSRINENKPIAIPGDRKHSAYKINLENGVDICEDVRQLLKV